MKLKLNNEPSEFDDIFEDSNVIETQAVFNKDVRDKWFGIFNEEQKVQYNELEKFIASDSEYYMLEGYAGVGKTFLITRVISSLGEDYKVVLTAPTNKAVKVLRDFRPEGRDVDCSTIHKLLSLTIKKYPPKPGSLEATFVLVKNQYAKSHPVKDYNLIIVDEASMLTDELFVMLNKEKPKGTKVIFMGDPAQIPPVNQADCIPLTNKGRELFSIQHGQLFKIMRQADGSKIAETGYQIRNNRWLAPDPILDRTDGNDISFLNSHHDKHRTDFVTTFLHMFKSDIFNENPDYCKVIAYKNTTVNNINKIVRQTLYSTQLIKAVMVGEKLIANKPIMNEDGRGIKFNTSDEFTVKEIKEMVEFFDVPKGGVEEKPVQVAMDLGYKDEVDDAKHDYRFEFYRCEVESFLGLDDDGEPMHCMDTVDILSEKSTKQFSWAMSKLKKKKLWNGKKGFFTMNDRFANVKYNYAITAHKSQGSTYKNVFILEDDIDTNRKLLERNRIKYTAVTRASQHLYLLSTRNKITLNKPIKQEEMF